MREEKKFNEIVIRRRRFTPTAKVELVTSDSRVNKKKDEDSHMKFQDNLFFGIVSL
jgi:hypothetical protein